MRRCTLTLLLLVVLAPAWARSDQADDYVARWLAQFKVPGVAVAVVKDGETVNPTATSGMAAGCRASRRTSRDSPTDRLTIIVLSNGDDSDMGALVANLALMYLPPAK